MGATLDLPPLNVAALLRADWTRIWYRQLTVAGTLAYGPVPFEGTTTDSFDAALVRRVLTMIERAEYKRRRNFIHGALNEMGIRCHLPKGAFYAFPRIDTTEPDEPLIARMVRETGVVVVHGSGFGQKEGTKHFRAVFLPQDDVLRNAYKGISEFMKEHYK